jgi:outer membrane protein OmpA-like peptidoglycan-associated protein
LLRLAAPIVMSVLGSRVAAGGLDAGGLSRLLAGERSTILDAAPAGVVNMLGLGQPPTSPTYEEPEPVEPVRRETSSSWWPYALAALAGLTLVYFLNRARQSDTAGIEPPSRPAPAPSASVAKPEPVRPAVPPTAPEPSAAPAASVRETPPATPPAEPRGALGQVNAFLTGSEPTPRRFTLDDLTFESGSARLAASSQPTVTALAGRLQKHPSARVRLEGHTDASGALPPTRSCHSSARLR